jgi:hypothetical protein
MRYEESYQGRPIVVTTTPARTGSWAWAADIVDGAHRISIVSAPGDSFATEEAARSAARSAAAAAVDRARTSRGKP